MSAIRMSEAEYAERQAKRGKSSCKPNRVCEQCGAQFYAPPVLVRRGGGRFCSYICRGLATRGESNPNYSRVKQTCLACGSMFEIPVCRANQGRGKYCSKVCLAKGKEPKPSVCACCGKEYLGKNEKYCSKACYSAANSGAGNWNWGGGRPTLTCEGCGKEYQKSPASHGVVCSQRCWGLIMVKRQREKTYSSGRGGKRADLGNQYFRSRWEANYARYLNWLIDQKQIASWQFEPDTFEFEPIKRGNRFYTPDFKVFDLDGSHSYHEIKGYMDSDSATKLRRMAKYFPQEKLVLIDKPVYQGIARTMAPLLPNWEHGK